MDRLSPVSAVSGKRLAVREETETQRETGNWEGCCGSVSGRAVIAMTAVRSRACIESGKVIDLFNLRPPTDVMAITSLPQAPANYPVSCNG